MPDAAGVVRTHRCKSIRENRSFVYNFLLHVRKRDRRQDVQFRRDAVGYVNGVLTHTEVYVGCGLKKVARKAWVADVFR
jgi:hypothetical protein